jgi:hypothetical protein
VHDSVEEARLNPWVRNRDDFQTYRVALMAEAEVGAVMVPLGADPVPRFLSRP